MYSYVANDCVVLVVIAPSAVIFIIVEFDLLQFSVVLFLIFGAFRGARCIRVGTVGCLIAGAIVCIVGVVGGWRFGWIRWIGIGTDHPIGGLRSAGHNGRCVTLMQIAGA